jgi:hypothetical protein
MLNTLKLVVILTCLVVAGVLTFYTCSGGSSQTSQQTTSPTPTVQQLQLEVQQLQAQLEQRASGPAQQRNSQVAPQAAPQAAPAPPQQPDGPMRGNFWNYLGPKQGYHYSGTSGAGILERLGIRKTVSTKGDESGKDPASSSVYEPEEPPQEPTSRTSFRELRPKCPYEHDEDEQDPRVNTARNRRESGYRMVSRSVTAPLDCGSRAYADHGRCHCYSGGWLNDWGMCRFSQEELRAMYYDKHGYDR